MTEHDRLIVLLKKCAKATTFCKEIFLAKEEAKQALKARDEGNATEG